MTLDELIEKLQEIQFEGYGNKICIFDDCYGFSDATYDEGEDVVSIY